MEYVVLPLIAIVVFLIALRKGFHKQALIVSASLTMIGAMLFMDQLTLYGLVCLITVVLAGSYTLICFVLSIIENRKKRN